MNVEFSYISLAAKWVRILLNDLSLLDYQKGFQKVNEFFAFLAQSRAVAAFEQRELRHGTRVLSLWRDSDSGFGFLSRLAKALLCGSRWASVTVVLLFLRWGSAGREYSWNAIIDAHARLRFRPATQTILTSLRC